MSKSARAERSGRHRPDAAVQRLEQRRHGELGVADDAVIRLVELVDLLRVDVDADELAVLEQVLAEVERSVLGEGVAERDHHVGIEKHLPCRFVAGVAEQAHRKRVVLGDNSLAVHRRDQRHLVALHEGADLGPGAGADRAIAGPEHRLLAGADGFGEESGDGFDLGRIGRHRPPVDLGRAVVGDLENRGGDVQRDRDLDRARPPGQGDLDRLVHDRDDVLDLGDQIIGRLASLRVLLDDGIPDHPGIGGAPEPRCLVRRTAPVISYGRIAGDRDQRKGTGQRHAQARDQVERTRAGGREADAELAAERGVAAGHERRVLLVLGDDPPHPLGLGDRDLHARRILAGAAEHDIDADILEHRDNGFMNPHHRLPRESVRKSAPRLRLGRSRSNHSPRRNELRTATSPPSSGLLRRGSVIQISSRGSSKALRTGSRSPPPSIGHR